MNMDCLVARGNAPWLPSSTAEDLQIWYGYDFPLAGAFSAAGKFVLFTAIDGAHEGASVWAYSCFAEDEAAAWGDPSFDSVGDLHAFMERQFSNRESCFALALEFEIKHWSILHVTDGLLSAASRFLDGVFEASQATPRERFQARLAVVEDSPELVDS